MSNVTRSRTLRAAALAGALGVAAAAWSAAPAGAATRNPCKLLKPSEIQSVLEQSVGSADPGLTTAVSKSCAFDLTAEQGKPGGGVHTTLMTTGGDVAFNVNSRRSGSEMVPGLGKAYYSSLTKSTGEIHILKGRTLMTVQIVYVPLGGATVDPAMIKDEAIQLGKLAKKRF
ncbi:MAG TPA: hypothetical protein VFC99_18550 [Acidimicrobiia bacterium]|nr:hypothetical protein [Acidimicrobiia bacterium]